MFEHAWQLGFVEHSPGPGSSSGYYVGIIRNSATKCYPKGSCVTYYNGSYYYVGSSWACNFPVVCLGTHVEYLFGEVSYSGSDVESSSDYIPFAPLDQQGVRDYKYFGVFYTYYWFAPDQQNSSDLDVYFMVNGNIYNQPPKQQYNGINTITPQPPSTYIANCKKLS